MCERTKQKVVVWVEREQTERARKEERCVRTHILEILEKVLELENVECIVRVSHSLTSSWMTRADGMVFGVQCPGSPARE